MINKIFFTAFRADDEFFFSVFEEYSVIHLLVSLEVSREAILGRNSHLTRKLALIDL